MSILGDNFLLISSILLIFAVFAGKTSYRFGVPVLVFFLLIGMLAGSEGILKINFDMPNVTQFIGIIALNFILFSGGMETSWSTTKPIFGVGLVLSTFGVILTCLAVGFFVHYFTNFSLYEGLLLGAIVSSTDAAAVFSILRSKNLALKNNLRPMLEFESGSNDPMAYMLTVFFLSTITNSDVSLWSAVPIIIKQVALGGIGGLLFGVFNKFLINRLKIDYEGLYPVLVIGLMFLTYSTTNFVGGNGFLAVYLCGMYIGNSDVMHKRSIIKAFDGFAWLNQIVLFLVLGLLVTPSEIIPIIPIGIAISVFLIIVARPLSVWICTSFFKMKNKSRWFVSWVGLRGAVPIVFATYPLIAGIEQAHMIFNIVFFIALSSVLIQGTTIPFVAKFLKVSLPEKAKPNTPIEDLLDESTKSEFLEIVVDNQWTCIGKPIVDLHFPNKAIIAMIERNGYYITPKGNTKLFEGDTLLILTENKDCVPLIMKSLQG